MSHEHAVNWSNPHAIGQVIEMTRSSGASIGSRGTQWPPTRHARHPTRLAIQGVIRKSRTTAMCCMLGAPLSPTSAGAISARGW